MTPEELKKWALDWSIIDSLIDRDTLAATQEADSKWKAALKERYEAGVKAERKRWEGVRQAWLVEGKSPAYHQVAKEKLKKEWPSLHYAIVKAIESEDLSSKKVRE